MKEIYNKTLEYLQLYVDDFKSDKRGKVTIFTCPVCLEFSCNFIPNTHKIYCLKCNKNLGTIIDLVRYCEEGKKNCNDETIIQYLKELFKLDFDTKIDIRDALEFYQKNNFDLVPIARNQKIPIEKEWTSRNHKDIKEWQSWLNDGLNIGVKCGSISGITVLDFDTKQIPGNIKKMLGNTLIQQTEKGYHYFYKYTNRLPKTRIPELQIDIENEGGQVVLYPSHVNDISRRLNFKEIQAMPEELIKFLEEKINLPPSKKTYSEIITEDLANNNFNLGAITTGNRNNFLIHLGGMLRKELNLEQTDYVLNIINKHFCKPSLPQKEIDAMIGSLDKYIKKEGNALARRILEYLYKVNDATDRDIKEITGEAKEDVDTALSYLVKENLIYKKKRTFFVIKRANWKDTFASEGKIIDYKMPYFYDVAVFRDGDILVIGAGQKVGKSHIGINIIKQLVAQGKKCYYINLESGNRYATISKQLGLKEGDYWNTTHFSPQEIELEKNAITIIDWLLPKDYAETDKIFQHFAEQLVRNGGNLIIFMQLRKNGNFFAEDMVAFFPAFVCRYFYKKDDNGEENPYEGYFEVDYIREPKWKSKRGRIFCNYNPDTKIFSRLDELENKEKSYENRFNEV